MLPATGEEYRIATDPTLSYTPSGIATLRLTLVTNSRKQVDGEWKDDKALWVRATVWRTLAEHAAETLAKSDLVIVTGRFHTEEWEQDGQKRSALAMNVDAIGPSLKWNAYRKIEAEQKSAPSSAPASSGSSGDPWASGGSTEEPPF